MAKAPRVSAPPPAPTPPPVVPPVDEAPVPTPVPEDGTLPEGQGAGNLIPDVQETTDANDGSVAEQTGEEVQPEIGGEPIEQTAQEERTASDDQDEEDAEQEAVAEEALEDLKVQNFDARTNNLGDWDGDGEPGGAAPAIEDKPVTEKTNAELGAEVGKAHASTDDEYGKPTRAAFAAFLNDDKELGGNLPNGKPLDDEFWTAYDQAYDREKLQLVADALDDEQRLRRVEQVLGLLSPRA